VNGKEGLGTLWTRSDRHATSVVERSLSWGRSTRLDLPSRLKKVDKAVERVGLEISGETDLLVLRRCEL
jgi:hypothetical protein